MVAPPSSSRGSGEVTDRGIIRDVAARGIVQGGGPLPYRDAIQRAFGRHDVSGIESHVGGGARSASRAMGAEAYTLGNHVAFSSAPRLHTAAHEAAHVIQQRGGLTLEGGVGSPGDRHEQHASAVARLVVQGGSAERLLDHYVRGAGGEAARPGGVQRYEAGEHAQTGDTQEELHKAFAPIQYTVIKGDTFQSIAAKFGISVAELKAANPDKVRHFKNRDDHTIEGFRAGDRITVPQKLNEMAGDAIKDPSIKIAVNGVTLDYGTVIAMGGDLFRKPEDLAKAPPDELKAIAALVDEEKRTHRPVSTERWQAATKGRFLDLAAQNEAHFAPSNAAFVAPTGMSTADHKREWEENHRKALVAARAGHKDEALLINAFGDHFLTDAFAAGHLFNKRDVMERFNAQLPTKGAGDKREFTKDSEKFFDAVAKMAFVGDVAREFSKYETVERHYGFHPNINSASRFSTLLQHIHLERPELLESAVAKGIHDQLNSFPGGLPVENAVGDHWPLSGDKTLNGQTLAIAKRAVAQSQLNVIATFRAAKEPDYPALFKRVWDYTPRPTAESAKMVAGLVASGTDINDAGLRMAVVNLIKENYVVIIAKLVELKALKLA